ncbi:MAG: hypothetical protein J1E85_08135 [Ruminococcus sp.]|nr:hypothetical protein [Ruminococcus sp.]
MDENKEFLTSENTEETLESKTTDVEDAVQENSASVFADELAEIGEDTVSPVEYNADNLQPKKKKHFIQVPIIISFIIVVGVALGFLVFKCFFNTSIIGTWAIEDPTESETTADEASTVKTYYVFEDDGVLSLSYGTMKYVGSYTLSGNEVTMEINSANLYATFEFSVTGNVFTGRTLTFEDSTYDTEYTFHSTSIKAPKLKVDEDFKPNDKLTGEWNYYDGIYDFVYKFNSNGTVSISQNNMLFVDGVYSCTDNIITIRYYADSEQTMEFEYEVDDDSLIINGLQYLRVGSASADEARKTVSELAW